MTFVNTDSYFLSSDPTYVCRPDPLPSPRLPEDPSPIRKAPQFSTPGLLVLVDGTCRRTRFPHFSTSWDSLGLGLLQPLLRGTRQS